MNKIRSNTIYNMLYEQLFFNREAVDEDTDSCDLHMMDHEDTEILGQFCDATAIHGEKLKDILLLGYIESMRM